MSFQNKDSANSQWLNVQSEELLTQPIPSPSAVSKIFIFIIINFSQIIPIIHQSQWFLEAKQMSPFLSGWDCNTEHIKHTETTWPMLTLHVILQTLHKMLFQWRTSWQFKLETNKSNAKASSAPSIKCNSHNILYFTFHSRGMTYFCLVLVTI